MGPTASGKTQLAMELVQKYPCDIISVDSAMVYRGMDIGTAKPSVEELKQAPHRLIDIADPAQAYSAGQFYADAIREIAHTQQRGRIPLLVGGTMLYFRALQTGLSPLPTANPEIRQRLTEQAVNIGWEGMHQRLMAIDPIAAQRINQHDAQRIQRALEVYEISGMSLTDFCARTPMQAAPYRMINLALIPSDREDLQRRIAIRFKQMLQHGFVEEVASLRARGDLHRDLPSLRAVGYSQIWDYLEGKYNAQEMEELGIIATRQLAKRQLTWLRTWPNVQILPHEPTEISRIIKIVLNDSVQG